DEVLRRHGPFRQVVPGHVPGCRDVLVRHHEDVLRFEGGGGRREEEEEQEGESHRIPQSFSRDPKGSVYVDAPLRVAANRNAAGRTATLRRWRPSYRRAGRPASASAGPSRPASGGRGRRCT